jgi:hypothetical protein
VSWVHHGPEATERPPLVAAAAPRPVCLTPESHQGRSASPGRGDRGG